MPSAFLLFWYIADTHATLIVCRTFPRVATRYGEPLPVKPLSLTQRRNQEI
jgi:hypothetical protein